MHLVNDLADVRIFVGEQFVGFFRNRSHMVQSGLQFAAVFFQHVGNLFGNLQGIFHISPDIFAVFRQYRIHASEGGPHIFQCGPGIGNEFFGQLGKTPDLQYYLGGHITDLGNFKRVLPDQILIFL